MVFKVYDTDLTALFVRWFYRFMGSKQAESPRVIPLANPSQRLTHGSHKEEAEADLMDERLDSFFPLQFTLNRMSLLDH